MNFRSQASALVTLLWRHRWGLLMLFFGMLGPLLLLEELVEGIHEDHSFAWDEQILRTVHAHASPHKDFFVFWATRLGYWLAIPALIAAIAILLHLKNAAGAAYFVVTVLGASLMNGIAKLFFGRVRPDLWTSILPEQSFSFPSGHSMISAALAFALIVLLWPTRLRYFALFCGPPAIFLVGLSRIYLGVHYPSDVLAGWSAGLMWATGVFFICRRYLRVAKDHQPALTPAEQSEISVHPAKSV